MLKFSVIILLAMSVTYSAAQDIFTDEMRKNTRMILCGTCKDDPVKQDLINFGKCVQEMYPKEFANIMTIRERLANDGDECLKQMVEELRNYARSDPAGIVKVTDCFRANVITDHLAKCYKSGMYKK
ncbi:unnamed protein product [Oppiella nova]|uniref:Uncharacterized protein n=1 Tax=Oppiella nova TaxID=334625 RepID=A0A7R9MKH8_9ACAR|nr:unnamed protein product [Oppiella nova]CAG2179055.1 unnamed protein product [Oppiella nova]